MAKADQSAGATTVSEPGSWRTVADAGLHPILAAALVDLQQKGYHGTTVRGIAAGVGLTMPSLYYHYGNKEGILFALLDAAMDDLLTRIRGGLEEAHEDAISRFSNFVTAVALHNTHRRDLSRLHDEYRYLGPELRQRYVDKRSIVEDTLAELLDEGKGSGVFAVEDIRFTMRVLLGMLNGILDWYQEGGPLTAEEIADRYTFLAVRMVLRHADDEVG